RLLKTYTHIATTFVTCMYCTFFLFFFFFFSSRRRHTRSDRDWSSDVCSSDLLHWRCWLQMRPSRYYPVSAESCPTCISDRQWKRSEERRVGKECRCGGWPEH